MAKTNSTVTLPLNNEQVAAFGVVLNADESLQVFGAGHFDAGSADDIARQLILLASKIRNAARLALVPAEKISRDVLKDDA